MTSIETLRNQLIDQILATRNEKLLESINEIFKSNPDSEKLSFNSFQLEIIQLGLQDIQDDNLLSESDLEKLDEEWMSSE